MSDKNMHIDVKGMSCEHCRLTVQNAIVDLKGVKNFIVNLNPGFVDILFDDELIEVEEIIKAINATEVYQASLQY